MLSRAEYAVWRVFPASLDVLRQPPYALTVALAHDDRAHEDLDRADALEGDLALARRLVQTELMTEFILRHGIRVIDLVAKDKEWDLGQLLHREESVELGLGLGESLVVFGVNKEDDTVYFGEVISPNTASCDMVSLVSKAAQSCRLS